MPVHRPYPKAPITEAIIDLRVEPRAKLQLDELADLHDSEKQRYPRRERTFEAIGTMKLQPGISASASAEQVPTGFRFTSADDKYVWQVRRDGCAVSRLPLYESWQPFRDEARRLWTLYRERTQPERCTRLAVRYVNRIDIPAERTELKEYFRTGPEVSPDLPQTLGGFFLQVQLPMDDLPGTAIINQTRIPPIKPGVISVVLDIDIFRDTDVPTGEGEIWAFFEQLHVRKNDIFEASITPKTRELFE